MATPTTTTAPKLTNLYNLRQVATPKSCFICAKETTSCLANTDVTDFLYTCVSHLSDPAFAKPAPSSSSPSTPAVPPEEIERVKKEWEAKQAKKKEKEKESSSGADKDKPASTWYSASISSLSSLGTLATSTASTLFPPPEAAVPARAASPGLNAKVFVLNRDIFAIRQSNARKAWQAKEAKQRLKTLALPSVPRGGLRKTEVGP